ncbi:polysaccharide biosynthesis tyrosine autokinase [Roseibacterium sp. SDUM158016]|uniref:GumC family protein n=1 Tax=Roseicyclus sediminis TaxID=2980997 RepID=UPI0021CFF166|nr:polysaccharide biosynthesis tyrosine autokinase [Roseibacterium sp. SDUM158016]MCU4653743.1 polysaccharide biosynthesis tyrosine autokinase [Roseibacterium sp. SDUM158016]
MKENKFGSMQPVGAYQGHPPPDDDDDVIDLRAIFARLWRGKWIILICTLFAGAFGYLTATQYVPIYRATAKVMFDAPGREIIDIGAGPVTPTARNGLQDQIEILRSTNLAEAVVDELRLVENAEFNPRLRPPVVTVMDRVREFVTVPEWARDSLRDLGIMEPPSAGGPPPDPEAVAALERRIVTEALLARLAIRPVPDSRVIEIGVFSENPRTAALVANTFAEQYIFDQLEARLDATRTATGWLSGRVEELRERLQVAEEAVETARAAQSFQAGQSLEITQQQLQALNATLSVARNSTRTAEATFQRLNAALEDETEYGAIPEFRNSPLIDQVRTRRTELLSQRASLLETVTEEHPAVQRVDTLLEEASRTMRDEAEQIVEASRLEWQSLQQEETEIEADVRALETLALEQSRDAVTIRQLEREAEASRILYENFLSRLQETSQQEQLEEPDARILTRAEPPFSPQTQRQNRTLAVSLIAGALAGIGIIFLLDKLNNTFRSAPQLEQMTGETVLGVIPVVGKRLRRKTVLQRFREKPKSALAEAVRSLRTSILFSNVDKPPKVVMFTSSVPREGKSTTATLVAMTSRQMGRSAIIVDCDLRLPALADLLGAKTDGPGLLSAIEGTATLEEAIHRDEESGLHVLMTKPSEPRSTVNAADILSSKRFDDMIEELKRTYDLVILDTPPTLAVADPRILSSHADVVVYVVRWDSTPRGAVLEGLKELRTINAPIGGVVLSMLNEAKASRYAYEGYSSYRGRYRNYYVD